jgi:hypothetical protein
MKRQSPPTILDRWNGSLTHDRYEETLQYLGFGIQRVFHEGGTRARSSIHSS